MDKLNDVKVRIAALIGALTGLWGWMGWLVVSWIVCMALDYLTGSMAAAKAGDWSSAAAKDGIWHKAGAVVVVLVATGADLLVSIVLANLPVIQLPFEYPGLICPVVLVWYIITELGSITENAVAMGAAAPAWLTKLLAVGKEAADKAGGALSSKDKEE